MTRLVLNKIVRFISTSRILKILIGVLGFLVIGLILLYPSVPTQTERQTKEVLDCKKSKKCLIRSIEHIHFCPKRDNSSCVETADGLDIVNYISSPFNYIDGEFTDQKYSVTLVSAELDKPWDMDFLPSGDILVTEKNGSLVLIRDEQQYTIAEFEAISTGLVGLMGVAVDPEFALTGHIFIYYTYDLDPDYMDQELKRENHRRALSKVVRFTLKDDKLSDEFTLLSKIPGSLEHAGGRLAFGPDGKLYATTGDGSDIPTAQDHSSYLGKILRLNKDGTVPDDNPFPGSFVYSMGHRNPQGIAWEPGTGVLYSSEHGNWRNDEINRIVPGGNYGWGKFECDEMGETSDDETQTKYIQAVVCFDRWRMAPSGMDFDQDPGSPWYGDLFVAGLKGGHLRRFELEHGKIVNEDIFFISSNVHYDDVDPNRKKISKRLRYVKSMGGALYLIGDRYGLVKIENTEDL